MKTISEIKSEVAVKFTVLNDKGNEMDFVLAIIEKDRYFEKKQRSFCYISKDESGKTVYCDGLYSGGVTGCGVNIRDIRPLEEGSAIITTDLKEIKRLGKKADKDSDKREEKIKEAKVKLLEELNKLPTSFAEMKFGKIVYRIEHDGFHSSPYYSKPLGDYRITRKDGEGKGILFDVQTYFRKNGMNKKRLAEDAVFLIGKSEPTMAMEFVVYIKEKLEEANATIRKMKNNYANGIQ